MDGGATSKPTARDAEQIIRDVLGDETKTLQRFPTGLCHYVFDVETKAGRRVVVRIAEPCNLSYLQGGVYWSNMLKPLGIPLPKLLAADLEGVSSSFPYMVLERLKGTDLCHAYPGLSAHEKQSIASRIVELQQIVGTLPEGDGFGFAASYNRIPHRSWSAVIATSLDRTENWIRSAGIVSLSVVHRVRAAAESFQPDFAAIRPVPFLDDITTKNVIIDGGRLSGIVDVDEVCFGDPLLTPALTRMALLSSGHDSDYVDFWCDALKLNESRQRVLTFYTAMFCVGFLAEIGQSFNDEESATVDRGKVTKLSAILDRLLTELSSPRGAEA